ncbi:hypothetical protein [Olleya namhaensis]|uniref:hypothetical protein n=1 Tax=Olleya namhaensis TaxID=1144750 RepID=UPI0024930C1C|nr:hypothetical protein [Olleya namhaensis]
MDSLKWGLLVILVNLINQILIVPFFLTYFDKEVYSLWLVMVAFILLIRTINLGQLNYSSNLINIEYFKGEKVDEFINSAFGANIVLVTLQLLVGFILSVPQVFSAISGFEIGFLVNNDFTLIFILLLISRLLNQIFSLFYLRLLEPLNLISKRIKYDGIRELLEVCIIITAIVVFQDLLPIALAILGYNLVFTGFTYIKVRENISRINGDIKIEFKQSIAIIKNSTTLFLSFCSDKLYENGLNIFITALYNPILLPLFSSTRTMTNLSLKFATVISEPLMPDLQKNYSQKDDVNLINGLKYYWKLTFLPIYVLLLLLLPIVEFLFNLWTKNKLDFSLDLFLWMYISVYFLNYSSVLTQFFRRTNFAKQLIGYSVTKTITVIGFLYLLAYLKDLAMAGLAMFVGEFISCLILLFQIYRFKGFVFLQKIWYYFFMSTVLSVFAILFLFFKNYIVFYISSIIVLIYHVWNHFPFKKNLHFNSK